MNIIRPQSSQPIPENAQCVFKGKIFDIYQWEQIMYDGSVKTFEKIKRPDTVVVFPVLDDGSIVLTQQQQPGTDSLMVGLGGRVEEGEDILDAIKRELQEESGLKASEWILFHSEQPLQKVEWAVYHFIAKGCQQYSDQILDGGEKIQLKKVSFDEFLQLARDRKFTEKEVIPDLYEALINPTKYTMLKKLFDPLQ